MDKKQNEISESKKPSQTVILLSALFILLVLILLAIPVYKSQRARADARFVLTRSKAVELAVITVSMEYYAMNQSVDDLGQPFGFAKGVEEQVKALSGCEGDVYLLQWDEKAFRPLKLMYVEGEYTSVYTFENNEASWNVYKTDHLIVH